MPCYLSVSYKHRKFMIMLKKQILQIVEYMYQVVMWAYTHAYWKSTRPPPPPDSRGTYVHFPSHEPPHLRWKRTHPLSREYFVPIGFYNNNNNNNNNIYHPHSWAFSGNLPETNAQTPLPKKWEHAFGPICVRVGVGGGAEIL